jgi:predicted SprT family Zn-dependent metalloprotease
VPRCRTALLHLAAVRPPPRPPAAPRQPVVPRPPASGARPGPLDRQAAHLYAALNRTRFASTLPACDVRFSARLTASGGMCYPTLRRIRLSVHLLHEHGWPEVAEVLVHEMAHLWVAVYARTRGRRRPAPHGPEFRAVLRAAGGHRLHCVPFSSGAPLRLHVYRCPQGHEFLRKRRLSPRLVCAACATERLPAQLKWVEQRHEPPPAR